MRLTDGTSRVINGRDIRLVYCNPSDLDDTIGAVAGRQTDLECTLYHDGTLLIFGTANWI